jgi:hypothetical protein
MVDLVYGWANPHVQNGNLHTLVQRLQKANVLSQPKNNVSIDYILN